MTQFTAQAMSFDQTALGEFDHGFSNTSCRSSTNATSASLPFASMKRGVMMDGLHAASISQWARMSNMANGHQVWCAGLPIYLPHNVSGSGNSLSGIHADCRSELARDSEGRIARERASYTTTQWNRAHE